MLARVAIASDALTTDGLPLAVANLVHRTLMEQLNAHARLVFEGDSDVVELLRSIKSDAGLPQDARTRWIETLTRLHKQQRIKVRHDDGTPLAAVSSIGELRASWGHHADVAIVAEAACPSLGIPRELGWLADPGAAPEVATSAAATHSPAMQRLKDLTEHPIALCGSSREEFWRDVLEPLAVDARSATVLDGYLFKARWDISTRKPWARGWQREQLAWLLDRLDAVMAQGAEVRLIGSRHVDYPGMDAEATADAVRADWLPASTGRLGRVTLVLAGPVGRERFPHDRHIRFSSGGAVDITGGFDRLRDSSIWDPDGMKWTYLWHSEALRVLKDSEERGVAFARGSAAIVHDR